MRDFAAYAGGTVSIAMPFGLDFIYVETLRTTDAVPHLPDVGFSGLDGDHGGRTRAAVALHQPDELDAYVAAVKAERPEDAGYVARPHAAGYRALQGTRVRGFARGMAARDLWRRRAALSHSKRRLPVGQLRHSVVPLFSAEQVERECGPRILGLARSIRSLVEDEQRTS